MAEKTRKFRDPRGFLAERGITDETYTDFSLRLDVLLAKIICGSRNMDKAIPEYWGDVFPGLRGNEALYGSVKDFYRMFRKTAMDIIKGVELSDESYPYYSNLQRMVVRYGLILNFGRETFTPAKEAEKMSGLLKETMPCGRGLIKQEVEADIAAYFGKKEEYRLSDPALELLQRERGSVQGIYDMLVRIVDKKEGRGGPENLFVSRSNSVKIESLLEECLLDLKENGNLYLGTSDKFERLFEKHWPQVYPNLEFTAKNASMVYSAIKKDVFLSAIRTLIIAGDVKDIRSPRIARCLAYGYTLKYVIVNIGSCRDMDVIWEEVSEMAAKINFVGVNQEEENDIIGLLSERYCRASGEVDEEIISYLMKHKERIGKIYQIIRDAFNSRFASKSLEERDRIISELQQRVEYEDINALKKAVTYLGDKDFGYVLNDLYRVCHGYDPFDERKVKDSLKGLFYVLGLLGIEADMADKVNQVFSETDELNAQCSYDDDIEKSTGKRSVRYPGWKVMGERVLPPVCMNLEPADEQL